MDKIKRAGENAITHNPVKGVSRNRSNAGLAASASILAAALRRKPPGFDGWLAAIVKAYGVSRNRSNAGSILREGPMAP
jgi:hypothetical protein